MEIKSNIRHRRRERVKQLSKQASIGHSRTASTALKSDRLSETRHAPVVPEQENYSDYVTQDPEELWKQRQRRWMDEEKHDPPGKRRVGARFVLSVILFAAVWGLFQIETDWAKQGQNYVAAVFTHSIQYDEMAAWYGNLFQGTPAFLPAFDQKNKTNPSTKASGALTLPFVAPVKGVIVAPFEDNRSGVLLETQLNSDVRVISTGRVIYAGKREDIGLTVIVQHADQYISVYGMLSDVSVSPNDWLESGERVGIVASSSNQGNGQLFFSISRNHVYIDPADVVKFD